MYNSIQQFNKFGVKEIEKTIKNFIIEGKDFGDLVLGLQDNLFELGRNILTEVLEDMDEFLRESQIRKNSWEIVRKDASSLLTSFGNIRYDRTYFKPKKNGKREYLVDNIAGICSHERMSTDVEINAIEEALENSYRKAGESATYVEDITKQTVMNMIHNVKIPEAKKENVKNKKKIKILYIEADEDHVSKQNKKYDEKEESNKIFMPKLVYIHEGYDEKKSTKSRKVLKSVRNFGGLYKHSEDLWLEVSDYIYEHYDTDYLETIYLSGDGASWIKQGLDWVPKSRFVLDKYHLSKYITSATSHLNDEAITNALKDAVAWPDKDMLVEVFDKILSRTEIKTKRKAVIRSKRYILNNWDGIKIRGEVDNSIIGCSAEGHVSHILSSRLSSRPKGWSKTGVEKMTKLLVYKRNGGKIYDLVMKQREEKVKVKKIEYQDKLVKKLRTESKRYLERWNNDIPVMDKGKKTGLYKAIRSKIGRVG